MYETKTTGAENDIEQATELARTMVTRWGMSDVLLLLTFPVSSGGAGGAVSSLNGREPPSPLMPEVWIGLRRELDGAAGYVMDWRGRVAELGHQA